ncbi:MAG: polyprenyl synthetase family protein [Firmicutes bacterium]|nr:polyprenyl synthetase family protein [Bacillota bacterium]
MNGNPLRTSVASNLQQALHAAEERYFSLFDGLFLSKQTNDACGSGEVRDAAVYAADIFRAEGKVAPDCDALLACRWLFLAADLLDDTLDGDADTLPWATWSTGELALVSMQLTGLALCAAQKVDEKTGHSVVSILQQTVLEAASGAQLEQELFRPDISEKRILQVLDARSGALFGGICRFAAAAAGANDQRQQAWACFGRRVGVAYQLENDARAVLDPQRFADLAKRLITLPVRYALDQAKGDALDSLQAYYLQHREVPLSEVSEAIRASGGLAYTWACSAAIAAEAQRCAPDEAIARQWLQYDEEPSS